MGTRHGVYRHYFKQTTLQADWDKGCHLYNTDKETTQHVNYKPNPSFLTGHWKPRVLSGSLQSDIILGAPGSISRKLKSSLPLTFS